MKEAGFAPAIVAAYRKELGAFYKNSAYGQDGQVDVLHNQYVDVYSRYEYIKRYNSAGSAPRDVPSVLTQEAEDIVFDPTRAEEYEHRLTNDFIQTRQAVNVVLQDLIEKSQAVEGSQSPDEFETFRKYLREKQRTVENFEMVLHARFGYWMTDTIFDMFVVDENLRGEIGDYTLKGRKRILGDHALTKIKAAESMIQIAEKIEVGEKSEKYRDTMFVT
jgi:hypothetical protein